MIFAFEFCENAQRLIVVFEAFIRLHAFFQHFLAGVRERSRYFLGRLEELAGRHPALAAGARGRGLLLGLVLTERGVELGATIVQRMFEEGALINFAGNAVLRFVPPLIVSEAGIDQLVDRLDRVLADLA